SARLQQAMGRYVYVLMSQLASSAACLRYHLIAPRLARWLLVSHDRAHSDTLGVRRVGVTAAARALQDSGLIGYARGNMTVLDRSGLEAAARSCYATDAAVYSQQTG
ncbi:MAG: helix-turn-helix domain-containing protein, partial [Variovorax sp.]